MPPAAAWKKEVIQIHPHPSIYIGDFNRHQVIWKYYMSGENLDALLEWTNEQNTYFVFNAKSRGIFTSASWGRDCNTYMCFVSKGVNDRTLAASRSILAEFLPYHQCLVLINIGISFPRIRSHGPPRWNLRRAHREKWCEHEDNILSWISPTLKNYESYVGAVISISKATFPGGYRT